MANISIGYRDKVAKEAEVTASSEVSSLPAENVADEDITKLWRPSGSGVQWLKAGLDSIQSIGWVACFNCPAETWRVRVSSTDPDCESGLVYDTGSTWVATDMGQGLNNASGLETCVTWFGANVQGRYIRVDLPASTDVGRLAAGTFWSPTHNYSYGATFSYEDLGRFARTLGGTLYDDNPRRPRTWTIPFDIAAEADANSFVQVLQTRHDVKDLLITLNRTDPEGLRDTIWGPPSRPPTITRRGPTTLRVTLSVTERSARPA